LCRTQRWTGASPKTVRIALRSAFDHEEDALLGIEATLD
jgi:hypothetical protein